MAHRSNAGINLAVIQPLNEHWGKAEGGFGAGSNAGFTCWCVKTNMLAIYDQLKSNQDRYIDRSNQIKSSQVKKSIDR